MKRIVLALTAALATPVSAAPPRAQLGRIVFPVTGPPAAQRSFLRGMLAMHSFWYEEAREAFKAATTAAPDFAMGYWGEAMTYFHPVWTQEDLAASRAVLAKIPAQAKLDERERGLVDALRILVGEGDRHARWKAYAGALGRLHERFATDDEV